MSPAHEDVEILPGVRVRTEDSTAHHWVGTCGTLVLLVLHEGSDADPAHVVAAQRAITSLLRRGHTPVQLLVVWPPTLGKPPSAEVRRAIVDASPSGRAIDRAAGVVLGTGFLPAMHRSAVTGILALARVSVAVRIFGTVPEAMGYLVGHDADRLRALTKFCEDHIARTNGTAATVAPTMR
jgi:hypothetical protein